MSLQHDYDLVQGYRSILSMEANKFLTDLSKAEIGAELINMMSSITGAIPKTFLITNCICVTSLEALDGDRAALASELVNKEFGDEPLLFLTNHPYFASLSGVLLST